MIRYLILVLALLLVAIRPAPAQGNLPKPVQSLPAYPPVRCVTVDWTVESCEWRQVQAAVEGVEAVAKAWAKAAKSEIPRYVLRDESGVPPSSAVALLALASVATPRSREIRPFGST